MRCELNLIRETPLAWDFRTPYTGLCLDGCHYYFLLCRERRVMKTDLNFCPQGSYGLVRQYRCLCYDRRRQCFWAGDTSQYLYRLDAQFRETDYITLPRSCQGGGVVSSLSYDDAQDALLLLWRNKVFSFSFVHETMSCLCEHSPLCLTNVTTLASGFLLSGLQKSSQVLQVYDGNGVLCHQMTFPLGCIIQCMLVTDDSASSGTASLTLFVLHGGCPRRMTLTLRCPTLWEDCCPAPLCEPCERCEPPCESCESCDRNELLTFWDIIAPLLFGETSFEER